MNHPVDFEIETKPFHGHSNSAILRRAQRNRGTLHTGKPGDTIKMSRGREYLVAPDGSFRRVKAA